MKNSLAFQLLMAIFGLYFIVTVIVTVIQLTAEYYHEKDAIIKEIQILPETFGKGIDDSLWHFNYELLKAILVGINKIPVVSGVKIVDPKEEEIMSIGTIIDKTGNYVFVDDKRILSETEKLLANLYEYSFPLVHTDEDGDRYEIGKWIVYSSQRIIIERIKYGFILILVNSVIKTMALWFIFLFIIRKMLGKPLEQLKTDIHKVHLDNLENVKISVYSKKHNELKIIENAFNHMIFNLYQSRQEINKINMNLEALVTKRTDELRKTNEQLKIEIKDREQAEEVLLQTTVSKDYLNNILKTMLDTLIVVNPDGTISLINHVTLNLLGYEKDEIIGKSIGTIIKEEGEQKSSNDNGIIKLLKKDYIEGVDRIYLSKNGKKIPMLFSSSVMRGEEDEFLGIVCVAHNMTKRKLIEKALKESEKRFRNIIQNTKAGYFLIDRQGCYQDVNNAWLKMHGYSDVNEVIGKHFSLTQVETDIEQAQTIVKDLFEFDSNFTGEFSRCNKDGSIGYHSFSANSVVKEDKMLGIEGFIIDRTKQKASEEQVKASLVEKEVLIKEIHHRVKNNLAMVSTFLQLQTFKVKHAQDLQLFNEARARIYTMALIHEKLYHSRSFSNIAFEGFIRDLIYFLISSYEMQPNQIEINLKTNDISLDINRAIPCGLIVNELVSNVFKHAYPEKISGEIAICLDRDINGTFMLSVIDNGVGIPENINIQKTETLGISLIVGLTKQLKGNLELDRSQGTKFTIKFP